MSFVDYFSGLVSSVEVSKGKYLFRQHQGSASLFFVEQGLVKAFYETQDGKEFIKSFIKEGQFIGSLQALVAHQPNSFSVIALENCIVKEISSSQLMESFGSAAHASVWLNEFLLSLAMKKEQREYEFLCLSAEERYLLFCQRDADLVPRLSQLDIARYLGITPVALSRIRRRLSF